MKKLISLVVTVIMLGGTASALPGGPMGDKDGDRKKAEKDWKDAEGRQKKGQAPGEGEGGPQQGGGPAFENPLEKILKLMKEVETRLYDADTGDYTREEQRKIVEAMKFEDKTSSALEELINQVEKQQQQMQSQSQSQKKKQQQQKQKKQQKNETKKQRRERERREKEREKKRQAQAKKDQQQKKDPKRDKANKERQKRQEVPPPRDENGELTDPNGRAGRWGQLPSKLHQDANNAANQPPPGRWRELIKRYRQRLADVEK